mmetsp:Transcript_4532/g.8630  ORF Transcript_4532/g.8630 Transcript_4532/m.8630 type:complete len:203 (-) Transcript_4532:716-1324(-)
MGQVDFLIGVFAELKQLVGHSNLSVRAVSVHNVLERCRTKGLNNHEPRHGDVAPVELADYIRRARLRHWFVLQKRHQRVPVQIQGGVDRNPCQVHDCWENVDQLGGVGHHFAGGQAVTAIIDHHRNRGRSVIRHHFVVLLMLHLHIAMVTSDNEDRAVPKPRFFDSTDVGPHHCVELGDHRVVYATDISPALCAVERLLVGI